MKIGYISDAHGNVGAFEQGLKVLEAFCCEQIFFLGDAIGYIPSAELGKTVWSLKSHLNFN
jgi:hypothetical protein